MLPGHEGKAMVCHRWWVWDRWLNVGIVDINENVYELASANNLQFKVIEIGNGIGFSPESNLAG